MEKKGSKFGCLALRKIAPKWEKQGSARDNRESTTASLRAALGRLMDNLKAP